MARQGLAHRVGLFLPEARRTLDVGEQEGERPCGQLGHGASRSDKSDRCPGSEFRHDLTRTGRGRGLGSVVPGGCSGGPASGLRGEPCRDITPGAFGAPSPSSRWGRWASRSSAPRRAAADAQDAGRRQELGEAGLHLVGHRCRGTELRRLGRRLPGARRRPEREGWRQRPQDRARDRRRHSRRARTSPRRRTSCRTARCSRSSTTRRSRSCRTATCSRTGVPMIGGGFDGNYYSKKGNENIISRARQRHPPPRAHLRHHAPR